VSLNLRLLGKLHQNIPIIPNWLQGSDATVVKKTNGNMRHEAEEEGQQSCGAVFGTMRRIE